MEARSRAPGVLIIGGFATAPVNYLPFARRLRGLGVARVDIAQLWPPDGLIGGILGFGPLTGRTRRAIERVHAAAGGQPIIVVGHSAGGILARLAMAPVPYRGYRGGAAGKVGALVTMGTPHGLAQLPNRYHHAGHDAAEFLDRVSPGAFFAPRTGYLTVGASFVAAPFRGPLGWLATEVFGLMLGDEIHSPGDGIVPASSVHLEGARQMTFDDVRHGVFGAPWYGDDEVIDRWWPTAMELWQAAIHA
jgi:pimeloyl-ACP methyl ester carboxylesterase